MASSRAKTTRVSTKAPAEASRIIMPLSQTRAAAIWGPARGPSALDAPGALSPSTLATSAKRLSSSSSRPAKLAAVPLGPARAVATWSGPPTKRP